MNKKKEIVSEDNSEGRVQQRFDGAYRNKYFVSISETKINESNS